MIEYEVKIPGIDIDEARRRLEECGAVREKQSVIHRNIIFSLPAGREIKGGWLRVRDEGDRVTMSLKIQGGNKIDEQLEYYFVAQSLEEGKKFLELIGAEEKACQEKRRETWRLNGCEVVIDEWPFLEPLMEIEGSSEETVMETVGLLRWKPEDCRICAVDMLLGEKYGVDVDIINNHTPRIIFDMQNPFLKS
jgi:adenylate cyclase class 2